MMEFLANALTDKMDEMQEYEEMCVITISSYLYNLPGMSFTVNKNEYMKIVAKGYALRSHIADNRESITFSLEPRPLSKEAKNALRVDHV